ncbi:Helitron helicase, partial [Phytophthora megakarya]
MPYALRQLFGTILVYSLPDHASALWDRFKKDFSEDYFKSIVERDCQNNIERDEVRLRMAEYKCLKWVAEYLLSNGKTLDMYGLPELSTYRDVSEEVDRDDTDARDAVANEIATYEPEDLARTTALADQMNENQKEVFDKVIEAVDHPVDGQKLFFVDGQGGTGKWFLLEQLIAHVRLQMEVAIDVASSEIAATLLTGGHTAHSTFRIPLKLSEFSTCSLPWQSQKAELIRNASLIIWDEAPMMHRACFETVDRSFGDIMKNDLEPFGANGDHRQILPVLKSATRAETLETCFKSSPLWNHLKKVRLTENMRGRYPINSDISESDICLLREMCIIPEERGHYRWDEEEHKESEDMEAPPNFNLLPAIEAPLEEGETNPDDDLRERN